MVGNVVTTLREWINGPACVAAELASEIVYLAPLFSCELLRCTRSRNRFLRKVPKRADVPCGSAGTCIAVPPSLCRRLGG